MDVFGDQSGWDQDLMTHAEEIGRLAGEFRLAATAKWPALVTALPVQIVNQVQAWLVGEKKYGMATARSMPISKATRLLNEAAALNVATPTQIDIAKKQSPPTQIPLTDLRRFVFEIIKDHPADQPISGKRIIEILASKYHKISSESTLTTHVIPVLRPLGVKSRKKIGYWFEPPATN
jgi:hypothetical protein